MTYFLFLAVFLGIPLLGLSILTLRDYYRPTWKQTYRQKYLPGITIAAICVIAFIYTTPWDNYLVATRVWWYDPDLVTGVVIGYVPIEEYTFFLLQPIFTGLILLLLMRYMAPSREGLNTRMRVSATLFIGVVWIISVALLILSFTSRDWKPATYLALELAWALLPVLLQVAFGGDIIWKNRRIVLPTIIVTTLYLCFADASAISAGTWTINPDQSLNIFLGGILPVEEFIFFLLTNVLVVFGLTLLLAEESRERANRIVFLRLFTRWIYAKHAKSESVAT